MKRFILLTTLLFIQQLFYVPQAQAQQAIDNESGFITCSYFGVSQPLSNYFVTDDEDKADVNTESPDRENRIPQKFLFTAADGPEYGNDPSSIQSEMGSRTSITIIKNWAGQNGLCPPDPTGAAGPNHYVQSVNASPFKIFNKSDGSQVGTIRNIGNLWSPSTGNVGDPIVLYDKYADRWLVTQLGNSFTNIYIAISTTNDPSGTYYTYTFISPQSIDYPKFSIWADGYYMTFNAGTMTKRIFCFERSKMLIGDAASRMIYRSFSTGPTAAFYAALPGDADGVLPPFGTPCPFFAYSENSWGAGSVDAAKIWDMTVDWTPATPTATVTGPITLNTTAFDATYDSAWQDIPQPGTAQKLDGIGGVCIFRAQWRRWAGYNSVVLNWGVKISATQRSIKWVELRQNQSTTSWSLYQQGTYTPDASSRWLGSIAMDDNGSIALCYAKSSSAAGDYPSLAFTGRDATDPLGQMTFGETVAFTGSGSQIGTSCGSRYGDYSHTSLDPDGITFWHTGEYLITAGARRTRIYSFQIPYLAGVETSSNTVSFSVYQSGKTLNVKAENLFSNIPTLVDIFDIEGRKISGKTVTPFANKIETSIDVSEIASGNYLVRIGNEKFQKVVKVVIN